MKSPVYALITALVLTSPSSFASSTYQLTQMPPIPTNASELIKTLEGEIAAFCAGEYGDKKIKGVAKDLCEEVAGVAVDKNSAAVASIAKLEISAKDASKLIILLGAARQEAKVGSEESLVVARRALYSAYAEAPLRTNAIFPGTFTPTTRQALNGMLQRFLMTTFPTGIVKTPIADDPKAHIIDISADNIFWYTEGANIPTGAKGRWELLLRTVAQAAASDLEVENYNFARRSRVLFFSTVKSSATSAKARVKGLDGTDWSLKWGDEMHSEVVANRAYIAAGAKYADLTFFKTADFRTEGGTVLLFPLDGKSDACPGIQVVDAASLVECLKTSKYKADIGRYILLAGRLTDAKHAAIRADVEKIAAEQGGKIDGNEAFVIFRESVVEFQTTNSVSEGGPIALRGEMSTNQALRGMLLWNMFIGNRDVKEDNGRSMVLVGKDGKLEYRETLHDQGFSLGTKTTAAELANLSDRFVEIVDGKLSFNEGLLYLPEIYTQATYADLKWMAHKIVSINEYGWRQIFAATNMPEYVRLAAVRKMLLRQLNIAEVFGFKFESARLRELVQKYSTDYILTVQVDRDNNGKAVMKATSEFGRSRNSTQVLTTDQILEDELAERFLRKLGAGNSMSEEVLKNGVLVATTSKNSLQHEIIETLIPSGIFHRVSRLTDYIPQSEMSGVTLHKPTIRDTIKYFKDEMGGKISPTSIKAMCEKLLAGGA